MSINTQLIINIGQFSDARPAIRTEFSIPEHESFNSFLDTYKTKIVTDISDLVEKYYIEYMKP